MSWSTPSEQQSLVDRAMRLTNEARPYAQLVTLPPVAQPPSADDRLAVEPMWRQIVSRLNVNNEVQDGCIKDNLVTLECLENSTNNPAIRLGNNLYDINTVSQLRARRDPATNEDISDSDWESVIDAQDEARNERVVARAFGMSTRDLFEQWKAFAFAGAHKPRDVLHTPRLDIVREVLHVTPFGEGELVTPLYDLYVVDPRLPRFARMNGDVYTESVETGAWPSFIRSEAGVKARPASFKDFIATVASMVELTAYGNQKQNFCKLIYKGDLRNVEFAAQFMPEDVLRDAPLCAVQSQRVEVARWLVRASRRVDWNLLTAAGDNPWMLYMLLEEFDAMFRTYPPGARDRFRMSDALRAALASLARYELTSEQRKFLATWSPI
jgi:hypothetical protein